MYGHRGAFPQPVTTIETNMSNNINLKGLNLSTQVTSVLARVLGNDGTSLATETVDLTSGSLELDGLVALSTGKKLASFRKRVKGETVFAAGITAEGLKEAKTHLDALSARVNASSTPAYRLSVMQAQLVELHAMGYTNLDLQPSVTSRTATIRVRKDAAPTMRAQVDLLQETNSRLRRELDLIRAALQTAKEPTT